MIVLSGKYCRYDAVFIRIIRKVDSRAGQSFVDSDGKTNGSLDVAGKFQIGPRDLLI